PLYQTRFFGQQYKPPDTNASLKAGSAGLGRSFTEHLFLPALTVKFSLADEKRSPQSSCETNSVPSGSGLHWRSGHLSHSRASVARGGLGLRQSRGRE